MEKSSVSFRFYSVFRGNNPRTDVQKSSGSIGVICCSIFSNPRFRAGIQAAARGPDVAHGSSS
jgi:hypothetical protein